MNTEVQEVKYQAVHEKSWIEYFEEYIVKRNHFTAITLLLILTLNIIGLFFSYSYSFFELFFFVGVLIIVLTIDCNLFIALRQDYFAAIICSLVTGLMPLIEVIINLSIKSQTVGSIITSVITLILALVFIFSPFILINLFHLKGEQNNE